MNKYFYIVSWFAIISAILMIIVVTFWLTFPYKTMDILNDPEPVDKTTYKPGETLTFHIDYIKYTKVRPIVTRQFVNGVVYTVPSYISKSNDIGPGSLDIQVVVPETLPDGKFTLTTNHRYPVNPLRNIDINAGTVYFEVKR